MKDVTYCSRSSLKRNSEANKTIATGGFDPISVVALGKVTINTTHLTI